MSVAPTTAELFQALGPLATALAEAVKRQICREGVSHVHDQPYDHALGSSLEQAAVLTLVSHLRADSADAKHLRDVLASFLELPARSPVVDETAPVSVDAEVPVLVEPMPTATDEPVWECELCPEPVPEPELPPVPVDPQELLGLDVVAQMLNTSVPYVRMLCRIGKLDFSAGDDAWYVRRFVVTAYLEAARERLSRRAARRPAVVPAAEAA